MTTHEDYDISDCPSGNILICRFSYSPDYFPIVYFAASILGILLFPKIVKIVNFLVFEGKTPSPSLEEIERIGAVLQIEKVGRKSCCRKQKKTHPSDNTRPSRLPSSYLPPEKKENVLLTHESTFRETLLTPSSVLSGDDSGDEDNEEDLANTRSRE